MAYRRGRAVGMMGFLTLLLLSAASLPGCGPPDSDPSPDDAAAANTDATDTGIDGGDAGEVDTTGTDGDVGGGDVAPNCTYFPDDCPEGESCYPAAQSGGERRCLEPRGEKSQGASCGGLRECGADLRCYDQACRAICDPDGTGDEFDCDSGASCLPLEVAGRTVGFGVCIPECTMFPEDDCPEGENCYVFSNGRQCAPYDTGAEAGDECDASQDCNADQICVSSAEDEPSRCRPKCDQNAGEDCESGECRPLQNLEFGACFPSGS